MNRDVAAVLEQIKSCLRYGGAKFLYALNTNTALLNISFSLSGSSPKYRSFVPVVKDEPDIINFAKLSLLSKISLQPSQTIDAEVRRGEIGAW